MFTLRTQRTSPKGRKTHTFEASLVQLLVAGDDEHRPLYLSCAGSTQELRAFVANLRMGRRAYLHSARYSERGWIAVPKTAPYRWGFQSCPDDTAIATAYLPELFELEPTTLPDRVEFVLAAPAWWLAAQEPLLGDVSEERRRDAAAAGLFTSYLDRRTRLPVVNDVEFHLQLWDAAHEAGWCSEPTAYPQRGQLYGRQGVDAPGLEYVRWVDTSQEAVEDCIAAETRRYLETHGHRRRAGRPVATGPAAAAAVTPPELVFATTNGHREEKDDGATGVPGDRWVLPDAAGAAQQLRLFGEG